MLHFYYNNNFQLAFVKKWKKQGMGVFSILNQIPVISSAFMSQWRLELNLYSIEWKALHKILPTGKKIKVPPSCFSAATGCTARLNRPYVGSACSTDWVAWEVFILPVIFAWVFLEGSLQNGKGRLPWYKQGSAPIAAILGCVRIPAKGQWEVLPLRTGLGSHAVRGHLLKSSCVSPQLPSSLSVPCAAFHSPRCPSQDLLLQLLVSFRVILMGNDHADVMQNSCQDPCVNTRKLNQSCASLSVFFYWRNHYLMIISLIYKAWVTDIGAEGFKFSTNSMNANCFQIVL